jgi:hypothetical protein
MKLFNLYIFLAVITFLIPVESSFIFSIISFSIVFSLILYLILNNYKINIKSYSRLYLSITIISILVLTSFSINFFERVIDGSETSEFLKLSILGLSTCFLFFSTAFIINSFKITDKQKINFLFYIVLAGGVNATITLSYWFITTGGVFERYNYTPPISDSNGIQIYHMMFAVFSSIALYRNRKRLSSTKRMIIYLAAGLCFLNMTTVMVREAWVIFIVSLFINWYITSTKSYLYKRLLGSIAFPLMFVSIYIVFSKFNFLDDIISLKSGDSAASSIIRMQMIMDSLNLFFSNPYFGVGYGTFSLNADLAVQLTGGTKVYVNSPHNALILMAAELGALGVISVFFFCYCVLKDLYKTMIFTNSNISRSISSLMFSVILLLSFDQLVSNSFLFPPPVERSAVQLSFLVWVFISVALSNSNSNQNNEESRN